MPLNSGATHLSTQAKAKARQHFCSGPQSLALPQPVSSIHHLKITSSQHARVNKEQTRHRDVPSHPYQGARSVPAGLKKVTRGAVRLEVAEKSAFYMPRVYRCINLRLNLALVSNRWVASMMLQFKLAGRTYVEAEEMHSALRSAPHEIHLSQLQKSDIICLFGASKPSNCSART